MNSQSIKPITIGTSILWAAAMIASSFILRGTEQATDIFFVLLALATASFLMLQRSKPASDAE